MLTYGFWYDVAKYTNTNWKFYGTEREVAINAYEMKGSWDEAVEIGKVTADIQGLLDGLLEDRADLYINGTAEDWEEVNYFVNEIQSEIKHKKLNKEVE